ncbi:hypothetical protein BAUCODRAFT_123630 [Baudoinia panamericana UAMH 10762]|uniref:CBS domain-containing protein n=1 Tax=Baudoinia panamericana (strain UAMH 10762) TaxID=717646 RepID=M2MEY0_BAUPA|nr:uncharacterized protein BAUCODRAFT_123630 [Baudoinia panamericana UAMH 10762]EMC95161.1 hypothetical protein BAUCODRAFT_123630 [Baudoinia panamericana UAMH 10762]
MDDTSVASNAPSNHSTKAGTSPWANKYRGATVEDLDPPPALSTTPLASISSALMSAFERDYTHLTVLDSNTKALLGYISTPRLRQLLETGQVKESDPVEKAMVKFKRKGKKYRLITLETRLEELEAFFEGNLDGGDGKVGEKQDFAVVTDVGRRFVMGVVTKEDLAEFVRRRPA